MATQPALLAHHCTEAGLIDKGISYWLRAGQKSLARSAMPEAVVQLERGLKLLHQLPENQVRQQQELDLQITLGNALIATRGYSAPEAAEAFARARQLCELVSEPARLGQALYGHFVFHLVRGELADAERHAKEVHQVGTTHNESVWKCYGLVYRAVICSVVGKFTDARSHTVNALALWDPRYRALVSIATDSHVAALTYLSRALLCLGDVDQAHQRRDEAISEARRLSAYNLCYALNQAWFGSWAFEGLKSTEPALRAADELLAVSEEQGFPMFIGGGKIMWGWCLGVMGESELGISFLLEGLSILRSIGVKWAIPFYQTKLAEIYGTAGQGEKGLDQLAEASKLIEQTGERWVEAELHRLRGKLLLFMGELAAAENSYRQALAVAQRQSAKYWELRTAISLGRLWRDQGKRTEAYDLLAPVYTWFTEGFDTPVLKEAKALLKELAS